MGMENSPKMLVLENIWSEFIVSTSEAPSHWEPKHRDRSKPAAKINPKNMICCGLKLIPFYPKP